MASFHGSFIAPPGGYFDCAYKGLIPRTAADVATASMIDLDVPWGPGHGEELRSRLSTVAGALLGVREDDVALIPSTSYGMALARRFADLKPGEDVVLLEDEHPAAILPWHAERRRIGTRIITARWSDADPTSSVLETLNDSVRMVCVPQTHWIDGMPLDLAAIGRRAREVGALLVIDATQSIGARPFDMATVRPDVMIFSGYKWLWGPPGLAYLYVAAHLRKTEPIEHSWINYAGMSARMFDGSGQLAYRDAPLDDMHRFDTSGLHNPLILRMALASLEMVRAIAPQTILSHNQGIVERLASTFPRRVRLSEMPRHFVGLRSTAARAIAEELAREGLYVSARGSTLRISPNIWNDDADIDRLVAALEDRDSRH